MIQPPSRPVSLSWQLLLIRVGQKQNTHFWESFCIDPAWYHLRTVSNNTWKEPDTRFWSPRKSVSSSEISDSPNRKPRFPKTHMESFLKGSNINLRFPVLLWLWTCTDYSANCKSPPHCIYIQKPQRNNKNATFCFSPFQCPQVLKPTIFKL